MQEPAPAPSTTRKKVIWWKLGLGLLLLPLAISDFSPSSSEGLKPRNAGEAVGYYLAASALLIAALWLIFVGLRSVWTRPE